MSAAYAVSDWGGFGVAVATVAGTLTGLLFIAVSINLKEILAGPSLPSRAAQTLILFATPLVAGVLVTVPGQARVALGVEVVATGAVIGGAQVWLDLAASRLEDPEDTLWRRMLGRVFPSVLSCGCLVVGGATLLGHAGGGLYWLVPSALAAVIFGLINTWVLLVEILR